MPSVKIYNVENATLDREIEYEFGDETLRDMLGKYDKQIGQESKDHKWNVSFGEERFQDMNLPLISCLEYGDSMVVSRRYALDGSITINIIGLKRGIRSIYTSLSNVVYDIKEEISETEGIPIELQTLIHRGRLLQEYKQLSYYNITNDDTIQLVPNLKGGGFSFVNVSEEGKTIAFSEKAPEWRKAEFGLNLEGRCLNVKCKAYKRMVIMNMGMSIIFKLGYNNPNKPTCCPMCKEYVKPDTCAFYKCEFRFIGVMETDKGPKRYKTDWKTIENEYYRYDEKKKCQWNSLVIEVKNWLNQKNLTQSIGCELCLRKTFEFQKICKPFSCQHVFHETCYERYTHRHECPKCRICKAG